jgi:two-component system sensor histidine kinase UhpB
LKAINKLPLYWRICVINASVFVVGSAVLVLSPATISSQLLIPEILVLTTGLAVIVLVNAMITRSTLAPLERLTALAESVDLHTPHPPLHSQGRGTVDRLVRSFDDMLDRLESERMSSEAKALAAQEAERQRIAQELHDEVGQGLTAVLLGLKRAVDRAPEDLADDLRSVAEIARASLNEVRDVAKRLRPSVLDDLGLLSAIASACNDLAAHSEIHVRRGFAPGLPPLSAEQELVIYRVAQEALTNVARHSGASTVTVSMSMQGNALVLLVADDGHGRLDRPEGTGILGMRERAHSVGGNLVVRTRIGGGTEVRLLIPTSSQQGAA